MLKGEGEILLGSPFSMEGELKSPLLVDLGHQLWKVPYENSEYL